MRWDEIAAQYDLVTIRPLLGGRIRIGYPPAVGRVDVNLTGERLLSETHLIGRVRPGAAQAWTFALPAFAGREIVELPCSRRVVIDDWIVDVGRPGEISPHGVAPLRGVIRAPDGACVFLHNLWQVSCFGRNGHAWTSRALFNADLSTVRYGGDTLSCLGSLDWIEPGRQFEILLSADTGEIVGGDPEAVAAHRG